MGIDDKSLDFCQFSVLNLMFFGIVLTSPFLALLGVLMFATVKKVEM